MDWDTFFVTYQVEDKYLAKAYEAISSPKRSLIKKQIYELMEAYKNFWGYRTVRQKYFSNLIFCEDLVPHEEALIIIEQGFGAINQILAVFIPLALAGVKKIGVVLLGALNKVRNEIWLGLELAGVYYLAFTSKKKIKDRLSKLKGPSFYFGFSPGSLKGEIFWQLPEIKGLINLEQKKVDLDVLFWANPHIDFYASWGDGKKVKTLSEKEDFFMAISEQRLEQVDLILGPGQESSWFWPDFNWTWGIKKQLIVNKQEGSNEQANR